MQISAFPKMLYYSFKIGIWYVYDLLFDRCYNLIPTWFIILRMYKHLRNISVFSFFLHTTNNRYSLSFWIFFNIGWQARQLCNIMLYSLDKWVNVCILPLQSCQKHQSITLSHFIVSLAAIWLMLHYIGHHIIS